MESQLTANGRYLVNVAIDTAADWFTWQALDDDGHELAKGTRHAMLCSRAGVVTGFASALGKFPITHQISVTPGNTVSLGRINVNLTD